MDGKRLKNCFVPLCTNSTLNTPNKIFIKVPAECKQRKMWFNAVNRKQKPNILKSTDYCCEDHFDLPNDMQNWMKFQLMPKTPKIMKRGVVPHIFINQVPKNATNSEKRKKQPDVVLPTPRKQIKTKSQFTGFSACFKDIRSTNLETTINLIKKQPLFYIGVPEQSFFIVPLLSESLNIDETNILLCLEKIKRDIGMVALGNDFSTTKQKANQYFVALIPAIAQELTKLIYWPSRRKILQNLPRCFRSPEFNKIQSVITCLEINVPEPASSFKKSIYWSERNKCYTYKYLVSCTPDGFINYISGNYGGKISDTLMLEVCGYLDLIPNGCHVLADGFTSCSDLLNERNCVLHHLTNMKSVFRTHLDEMLNYFKLFQFIRPFSYVDSNYLYILDNVMLIVAGLINLRQNK